MGKEPTVRRLDGVQVQSGKEKINPFLTFAFARNQTQVIQPICSLVTMLTELLQL
jgi:hypothetical protein